MYNILILARPRKLTERSMDVRGSKPDPAGADPPEGLARKRRPEAGPTSTWARTVVKLHFDIIQQACTLECEKVLWRNAMAPKVFSNTS